MNRPTLLRTAPGALLLCSLVLLAPVAGANGPVGDHVEDLAGHVEEYTGEVRWLIEQVDGIVDRYEAAGAEAAAPEAVVDHWEAVKFHAAIEVNYIPIYASIWQGLFGVRTAIEEGRDVAVVRAEQAALEQTLWQALGAVRLASQYQQQGKLTPLRGADAATPAATLDEIRTSLDRVVAKFAERLPAEAKEIVFDTYLTRFEGLEGDLIEQDADLVEDLEKDFNVTLPQALDGDATVDAVREIVAAMHAKLERARTLLAEVEARRADVF